MDLIERTIQASWRHRVLFTEAVFDPSNPVLKETLGASRRSKTLIVVDEALAVASPGLSVAISRYFAVHHPPLHLVCPPLIRKGGEQAKASWGDVFEIHRVIDMH